MGKSAEVIDGKGDAMAPLRKRVRNYMKTKGIEGKCRIERGWKDPRDSVDGGNS
jgi:hypothetical protein